jgi:hypothetical protein
LFSPNQSGYYPIHELFFSQPVENIKAIIELELFDLFVTDSFSHYTPLHILCWRNDREKVVKLFFELLSKNQLQKLKSCVYKSEALYWGELKTPAQILTHFKANCLLDMLSM